MIKVLEAYCIVTDLEYNTSDVVYLPEFIVCLFTNMHQVRLFTLHMILCMIYILSLPKAWFAHVILGTFIGYSRI